MKNFIKTVAVVLTLCFVLSACGGSGEEVILSSVPSAQNTSSEVLSSVLPPEVTSTVTTSAPASSKKPSTSKKPATTTTVTKPVANSGYQYNTNLNIEDNVFMDSLIYTGYNMKKHRADGLMWVYILAKRAKGWLSKTLPMQAAQRAMKPKTVNPILSILSATVLFVHHSLLMFILIICQM